MNQLPTVSVITISDARPERTQFHQPLTMSVAAQVGVTIEWFWVTPDTPEANAAVSAVTELLEGTTITLRHIINAPDMPVGARRNLAVDQAEGTYIANLDDDDVLYRATTLLDSVTPMEEDTSVLWTATPILDLLPSLDTSMWDGQLPAGKYSLGAQGVINPLTSTPAPLSVHSTTVVTTAWLERCVGGWDEKLPQAEDIARTLKLADLPSGEMVMLPKVGWLYRKHPHSMMAQPGILARDKKIIAEIYARHNLT